MNYDSTTTLNEIRAQHPCKVGREGLLSRLGKTKADDEPLSLITILDSNGIDDALWCLRVPSLDRLSRHFQAWCVEQVLHIFEADRPNDSRMRNQIAMLRNDDATPEDRIAARVVSHDASSVASWSASRAASRVASWSTEREAELAVALEAERGAQENQLRAMIGGAK